MTPPTFDFPPLLSNHTCELAQPTLPLDTSHHCLAPLPNSGDTIAAARLPWPSVVPYLYATCDCDLITPFSAVVSRGHGRLATTPTPLQHSTLLLPLRGPPGFRSLQKRLAGRHSGLKSGIFLVPPQKAELDLGSRCHLPLGAPREKRGRKGITQCRSNPFHDRPGARRICLT